MFLTYIYLDKSSVHGIGVFSKHAITKGTKIYISNLSLNLTVSQEKFEKLSQGEQQTIKHYGYFNKVWHLAFDDIRFVNHSKQPNITKKGKYLIASKDIFVDEELLQDYSEFETPLRKELK